MLSQKLVKFSLLFHCKNGFLFFFVFNFFSSNNKYINNSNTISNFFSSCTLKLRLMDLPWLIKSDVRQWKPLLWSMRWDNFVFRVLNTAQASKRERDGKIENLIVAGFGARNLTNIYKLFKYDLLSCDKCKFHKIMCIYYLSLSDFTFKMTKTNHRENLTWTSFDKGPSWRAQWHKSSWDWSKTMTQTRLKCLQYISLHIHYHLNVCG